MGDFTTQAMEQLSKLLRQGPFVVLTGAGLSTGSGIPAYRDQHGQWQHSKPIQHQDFLGSEAVRQRYWARSLAGWPRIAQAHANDGHQALAELERRGLITTVITQNVDGLHHLAGSSAVIELHGSIGQVLCLSCRQGYPRSLVQDWLLALNPHVDSDPSRTTRSAPDGDAHLDDACYAGFRIPACPACHGVLKPDVVFFGDNVPRERVVAATQAVDDATGLLVVGSTLMVYSGFRFADLAHRMGKPVIAINRGVTRADALLIAKIDEDCSTVLVRLLVRTSDHD
jgi:NAD-dependent SIR2 family protein deacetylase